MRPLKAAVTTYAFFTFQSKPIKNGQQRMAKMGLQQEIHFESGLLTVDARGEFSLEEAKQAFLEMLAAVAQYHAEKVLFDGRNLKGTPEHIERFYYGYFAAIETMKLIAQYPMRRAPRFAYLINAPLRDPRRYGETVAVNLGMTVKTFETPEEAFEWLELTPPNKKPDADDL
jgi:hypothetical protein